MEPKCLMCLTPSHRFPLQLLPQACPPQLRVPPTSCDIVNISVQSNLSGALPASSPPAEHIWSADTVKPLEESIFLGRSSRSSPDLEITHHEVVDVAVARVFARSSASDDLMKLSRMRLLTLCPSLSVPCPCSDSL